MSLKKIDLIPRLTAAMVLAIALVGCGTAKTRAASASPRPRRNGAPKRIDYAAADSSGIVTTVVQESNVPNYLPLPARIEADPTRVVHVYPPAGGRILAMKVRPWQWVSRGQTLAILDSPDLTRAVADYHKALADYEVKQQALARAKDLLAHNAIATKDYQQAGADEQSAAADVEAAREEIVAMGMDPSRASTHLTLAAPQSGVVLDVGAAPGEYSNALAAAQPLCTIADLSRVWAVGDIYEKDLLAVRPGLPAEVLVDAYPDQIWRGRVGVLSDAVDPVTRTLHVRVVLPNPGARLKPSMFGIIRILRSTDKAIVLPATAVIREGAMAYVYVAKANGIYQKQVVTLGRALGSSLEVAEGLRPGETVVTQGALLLREATEN